MADLAFLWHMHQPDYRRQDTGEFVLPWVLLHAIKDYADMARHLERHPGVRCTVNFVPVLLDQIDDYADQLATGQWRDPLLRIAARPDPESLTRDERAWLLDMAFRCHAPTMLEPFAPYRRLRDLFAFVKAQDASASSYLSGRYHTDLATWFLLAWSGESLRRESGIVPELMAKGDTFELADRERLLAGLGDVVRNLVPRYRALAERGQIELSCTPAHHPLAPLMLDFKSAREAWPESPLPHSPAYPGGRSRVEAHLTEARTSHERRFGREPAGLWPAEGALSMPFLKQIAESGFQWTASSHGVLRHSAGSDADTGVPWQAPEGIPADITLFFRNEKLSDLIGFEYANWHGRDAAQHFMVELEAIDQADPRTLIPVFLDGENAWEYYPYNAWYFFSDLYSALENHPTIRTVTLGQASSEHRTRRRRLPQLTAGSWVYGTLSTWIGNPDKNRAWDLLCETKLCADRVLESGHLSARERVEVLRRLAVCESSDWFWWLGDYNSPQSVASFDNLFRDNLKSLYRLMRLPLPQSLEHPISHGGGSPESGGTMRRATPDEKTA
ncbi:MAG: glycoside hydrolase [Betaproteobacteria bacterium]